MEIQFVFRRSSFRLFMIGRIGLPVPAFAVAFRRLCAAPGIYINEHRSAKMRKCRCMKLLRAVSGCPLQERIFIFLCFCTAKLARSRTALLLPDGCWMRCCGSCTGCGLRDFEKLEGLTLQGIRAFDSVVPIQFPVMIFMISRSVSRMPTRPRRPTFLIVPSTPSARIPSPAQKLLPVRHIS